MVGYLMIRIVRDIEWDAPESSIPRLPSTPASRHLPIAAGIGFGVIGYVVVMCATGKVRQIHPLMWAIAPFFLLFFAADWLEVNVYELPQPFLVARPAAAALADPGRSRRSSSGSIARVRSASSSGVCAASTARSAARSRRVRHGAMCRRTW